MGGGGVNNQSHMRYVCGEHLFHKIGLHDNDRDLPFHQTADHGLLSLELQLSCLVETRDVHLQCCILTAQLGVLLGV